MVPGQPVSQLLTRPTPPLRVAAPVSRPDGGWFLCTIPAFLPHSFCLFGFGALVSLPLGGSSVEFVDRLLLCADCGGQFIFTAGEQLFFFDKQFKNDPKRCKPCKGRRSGATAAPGSGPAAAGISRTETRTTCSACEVETTVPFKPTQGRPVLCRQCFQQAQNSGTLTSRGSVGSSPARVPVELVAAAHGDAGRPNGS